MKLYCTGNSIRRREGNGKRAPQKLRPDYELESVVFAVNAYPQFLILPYGSLSFP